MQQTKLIEVAPYDPNWPQQFAIEATILQKALGSEAIAIYHVGSTSVVGLPAKPKIDIIVEVCNLLFPESLLTSLGYNYRGCFNIPLHKCFTKRNDYNINLHVFEEDNPEIELNLMFRDYLRANPAAKDQYQALKFALIAEEFSHEKNNSIYVGYTLGKHDFINNILKQAGFNKHRFVFCTHYSEIKAAQYFRTNYFFAHNHIKDPGGWTFNSQYHKHMVFYQGVEIIGYAHIQLWSDKRAALRIIVIDLPKRNNNFGSKFLQLIEKWLKNEGYKSIHTEVTQTSLEFYRKNGYVEMKFNDPDRYKCGAQDVALGKIISHDV